MAGLRVLVVSTPVGPLGSGIGGGVELTLHGLVSGLQHRGHQVTVVAPAGSVSAVAPVVEVPGALQPPSQHLGRDAPVAMPVDGVLANMWAEVGRRQGEVDVVLNLAYDWLPFYLTPFLAVPVAHLVSMGSLSDAMDEAVVSAARRHPGSVAVHSSSQAATFAGLPPDVAVLGSGLDLSRYHVVTAPERRLGWVARIAPEKGLDDAFAVAERTGLPLSVWGLLQDEWTWKDAADAHPAADVTYEGFLPTDELQAGLGRCAAMLMTPRWVEAFGNTAIEAMACGVPVVAYRRGGPAEIVVDGVTGFLVEPDDIGGLAEAVTRVGGIDRWACRAHVEAHYSLDALAHRVETWLVGLAR